MLPLCLQFIRPVPASRQQHRGFLRPAPFLPHDRTMEELWTSKLGKVFDTAKSKQMVPGVVARDAWPSTGRYGG